MLPGKNYYEGKQPGVAVFCKRNFSLIFVLDCEESSTFYFQPNIHRFQEHSSFIQDSNQSNLPDRKDFSMKPIDFPSSRPIWKIWLARCSQF